MKVLLVDDEHLNLVRLQTEAKKALPEGTEIFAYENPLEALKESKKQQIDIAFLDIEMPELNGIQLAKELKKINPTINVIFVTAYDSYAFDAYKIHASGYLSKPVKAQKITEELEALRHPILAKSDKRMTVKCFGNFEVFVDGNPLKFQRSKSKELFAYLVDREGATANINELNAVLWEEDHKSYLRNLIADIQQTLKAVGCSDVFIKRHNECCIDPNKIECDAYEYKRNNPDAVRAYRGEYMIQYSWAFFSLEYDD
jgi:two-component SAPR family response regulator